MAPVRRWRLRTIMTAVTAGLLLLLGAIAGALAWKPLREAHEARLDSRGRLLAKVLATAAAADLAREGGTADGALASLDDEPDLLFAAVLGDGGSALAAATSAGYDTAAVERVAARDASDSGRVAMDGGAAWVASASYVQAGFPAIPAGGTPSRTVRAVVGLSSASMRRELNAAAQQLVAATLIAALIGSLVAFAIARSLTQPLAEMAELAAGISRGDDAPTTPIASGTRELGELADALTHVHRSLAVVGGQARRVAAGDLSQRVTGAGSLGEAFNAMVESLSRLVGQIQAASIRIASASDEILSASRQAEKGSAEQASSINQTTATMDELLSASKQIASSADSVVKIAERTLGAAKAGEDAVQQSMSGMQEIDSNNRQTAERILELSERNQQIGNIVELIDEIADKSDLLALNAAIEGAKAGEAGRGFAVVATEMRALAENVVESTKEIKALIGEIQKASNASVLATEGQMKATERGTQIAERTGERLREILQMVVQTTEAAKQISLATQQQRTGTEQVVQSMGEIARIARTNVAGSGQTTASTRELAGLAEQLRQAVSQFRLGQGG